MDTYIRDQWFHHERKSLQEHLSKLKGELSLLPEELPARASAEFNMLVEHVVKGFAEDLRMSFNRQITPLQAASFSFSFSSQITSSGQSLKGNCLLLEEMASCRADLLRYRPIALASAAKKLCLDLTQSSFCTSFPQACASMSPSLSRFPNLQKTVMACLSQKIVASCMEAQVAITTLVDIELMRLPQNKLAVVALDKKEAKERLDILSSKIVFCKVFEPCVSDECLEALATVLKQGLSLRLRECSDIFLLILLLFISDLLSVLLSRCRIFHRERGHIHVPPRASVPCGEA
jgi:hypothetical protein